MIIELGQTLWYNPYHDCINSGKVVAIFEPKQHTSRPRQVCLETTEGLVIMEVSPVYVFPSLLSCQLHVAQKLQSEASSQLSRAAKLFQTAGLATIKQEEK